MDHKCLHLHFAEIGGKYISVKSAGNLSALFDVGGIVGGILAGYISDKLNARAITAASFMYAAIPSMLLYKHYGSVSMNANIGLMMVTGLLVNGPYALITTAVSADLGTHSSLRGDSRALATVTAIIDGTGSVGAAVGPLLTGFLSTRGWTEVFMMLVVGAFIAGLLLSRLIIAEIAERSSGAQNPEGNECFQVMSSVSVHAFLLSILFLLHGKIYLIKGLSNIPQAKMGLNNPIMTEFCNSLSYFEIVDYWYCSNQLSQAL